MSKRLAVIFRFLNFAR